MSLHYFRLLPPIKVYETDQTTQSMLLKDKEMIKLPQNELDFLKKEDLESKKDSKAIA